MTQILEHWFFSLASQDMALILGVGFIALGCIVAILRKAGDWD